MTRGRIALLGILLAAGAAAQDPPPSEPPAKRPPAEKPPAKKPVALKTLPSNAVFRDAKPRIPLLGPGLMPVVAVSVESRGPIPLAFDTGCSGLILFDYLAKPLALDARSIDAHRVATGGGSAVSTTRAARIGRLHLLDGRDPKGYLTDVDALLFPGGPKVPGIRTHGVFGGALLGPLLVTFDLKRRWLEVEHAALGEPDGDRVLAMRRDDLSVESRIGDDTARFTIDTGYVGGFLLPPSVVESLGLRFKREPVAIGSLDSAGGSFPNRVARLDGSIRLGGWTFVEPIVHVCAATAGPNLGVEALRHFVVSLDQRNGRARFAGDGDRTIRALPYRRLGVTVETRDERCVIATVEAASAAHRAGLRAGDVVLEAEGLPGTRLSNHHIAELERELRRPGVRMRVRRGDEPPRAVDVPFSVVVP